MPARTEGSGIHGKVLQKPQPRVSLGVFTSWVTAINLGGHVILAPGTTKQTLATDQDEDVMVRRNILVSRRRDFLARIARTAIFLAGAGAASGCPESGGGEHHRPPHGDTGGSRTEQGKSPNS